MIGLKVPKKHEVVTLGAGAVGCSIAYHLAQKGIFSQYRLQLCRKHSGLSESGRNIEILVQTQASCGAHVIEAVELTPN